MNAIPEAEPPVEFWENNLELDVTRHLEDLRSPGALERWVTKRNAAQVTMLRHLFGLSADAPIKQRKTQLKELGEELLKFAPAALFAMRKSRDATVEVARNDLDDETMRLAMGVDDRHDTTALIFAIQAHSWVDLEKVFHLDKLHKVGFERLRLVRPPKRPAGRFSDFVGSDHFVAELKRFDAESEDRHTSEFKQKITVGDGLVVFIRRPHQPSYVLTESRVTHGFTPDQIVLDFRGEAALLNIASHNHAASYEIANRIASAFYDVPCAYESIVEETFAAQLQRLLQLLANDEATDLLLVEIKLLGSPLVGAPDLTISNGVSIGPALRELERALDWTIDDLAPVRSFKVLYKKKRIPIEVERLDIHADGRGDYVLRYRDQALSLGERRDFEELFEHQYGIKILSTEKRGARGRPPPAD